MNISKIKMLIMCVPFFGPLIMLLFMNKKNEEELFYLRLAIFFLQVTIFLVFMFLLIDVVMIGAYPKLSYVFSLLHNVVISFYLSVNVFLVFLVVVGKGVDNKILRGLTNTVKI